MDQSSHWLVAPDSPLRVAIYRSRRAGRAGKKRVDINGKSRELLDAAVSKARPGAPVGKVIAELPFGFWRYCTSAGHEKALWVPYLHHAFPAGTSRRDVDEGLGHLNALRNRIAHHEPLLRENLDERHVEILDLCGMLNPTLARYLASTSTVPAILAARPDVPATPAEPTRSETAEELVWRSDGESVPGPVNSGRAVTAPTPPAVDG